MARVQASARWVAATLLVAVVATTAWASSAAATPQQAEGDCIEVWRWDYVPMRTITPPDHPTEYGREHPTVVDDRFRTKYCVSGGKWSMTEDGFPYDKTDTCIEIYHDPDEYGGEPAPDRISPLDKIDEFGSIDSMGGLTGTEFRESYCRDGNIWVRTQQDDDYPEGSYTEWSRECVTIGPPVHSSPTQTTRHPSELGNTEFREFVETLGPEDLKTYCLHKDRDVWYRVDDYPLEEILGDDERPQNPESGTCVVLREAHAGVDPANLPETLPEFGHPGDYGWFQDKDTYLEWNGGRDQIDPQQAYCYVNGLWRRSDTLDSICDAPPAESVQSSGLLPDGCWGSFPSNNYDIGYHEGAWNHFDRRFYGWWTGFFFDLGKGATQVSLWSIGWAYNFDISEYDQFGLIIGEDYRTNLTENPPFHLVEIAWLSLFAWAGFNALRGKLAMAGGEIVVSILLVGLSTFLMTHRADYMESTWELMDKASSALLVAGQGKDPAGADDDVGPAVRDVQKQIHGVFVEQPYDYLNWGHPLAGPCADARNEALALGPHGSDDTARDLMGDADCDAEVDFNETPNGTRLLGTLLSMLASFVVSFVLLAVALTVVIAKFGALLLFALAPFAALAAIFPAGGRRVAWLWFTTLMQMVGAVIGMSFLLSVLLLGVRRLLEETAEVGLVERFFIVNLCVLVVAMARRRLLAGGAASAGRLADNLTNVRLGGGGATWQGPSASAGANLLNIDRGMRQAAWGAGAAAAVGGRIIAQRLRERRAWHNTLKARIAGDKRAGVGRGVVHKSYYSDAPGGSSGPGPRGGYNDAGSPGGPPPGGPPPGGGAGARPGAGPGPRPRGGPGAGGRPRPTAGRPVQTPRARAAAAAADGRTHDATYWGALDSAGNLYRADAGRAASPAQHAAAKARYTAHVRGYRDRYEKATGGVAPMHPEPWAGGTGRGADGGGWRPEPGGHGGDGRSRPPAERGRPAAPEARPFRQINEVVVTEPVASWRYPIRRVTGGLFNRATRQRGRDEARRRGLR